MIVVGIHLLQPIDLVGSRRRSAVALVGGGGNVQALDLADADEEVIAAVPEEAAWLCVDAPLAVPNREGSRPAERVLAWCDVPAFPVSLRRLETVFGGARGVALSPRSRGRAGRSARPSRPRAARARVGARASAGRPGDGPGGLPARMARRARALVPAQGARPGPAGRDVARPGSRGGRPRPRGLGPAGRRRRLGRAARRRPPRRALLRLCGCWPAERARPRSATPHPATSPSRRTRTCAEGRADAQPARRGGPDRAPADA